MALIEMKNVGFRYPNETADALCSITFSMEPGSCWCVSGPNGCGKTTLFRIISGLEFPTSGAWSFDGEEITAAKMKKDDFAWNFHRRIGYLFQDSDSQLFTSSVEEEVAYGIEQAGLSDSEVRERTERYLAMFHLTEIRKKAPFNISGGEKKRCALAAILATEPRVLILDEPYNNLDEDMQKWLLGFLKSLKSPDRLIIFADHHHNSASALADHFLYMDKTHRIVRTAERTSSSPQPGSPAENVSAQESTMGSSPKLLRREKVTGGDCFEFVRGSLREGSPQLWDGRSVYISEDDFVQAGLDAIFRAGLKDFAYYGITKVTGSDWERLLGIAEQQGDRPAKEIMEELDVWVRDCFRTEDCFTICGV